MPINLQNWNALISTSLHPENKRLTRLTEEAIEIIIQESKKEQDKVRSLFLENFLERRNIKDKKQYVRLNQAVLIRLLDKLYSYRQTEDLTPGILRLYTIVSTHLENSLNFIKDFFGNFFDRNQKVPDYYFFTFIDELQRQVELLKHSVKPYGFVGQIIDILVNQFNKFCSEKNRKPTYNELTYQKDLINELLADRRYTTENSINRVLFYLNYNEENYIEYLYEKLEALTKPLKSNQEKVAALRLEQKGFNQFPARHDIHFSGTRPSLTEEINHWIEEEIKFLETQPVSHAQSSRLEKEKVYVHVPFKGPEIYLLYKAFIDSGGTASETYKSLFEKTGSHLANKNQKGFSTESLQKNSDKVDYQVKEDVKRFLQKMIRNIDSY